MLTAVNITLKQRLCQFCLEQKQKLLVTDFLSLTSSTQNSMQCILARKTIDFIH